MIGMMERLGPTMELMRSAASTLGRQPGSAEYSQQSDNMALRLQPASRQELAAIVHRLQARTVTSTSEPPASQRDAELAVLELTPEAAEDIRQVELTVTEIGQSPQFKRALQLFAQRSLTAAGKVTPWAALVLAARWLVSYATSPLSQDRTATPTARTAPVSNHLVVLGIIVALATLIIMVSDGQSE